MSILLPDMASAAAVQRGGLVPVFDPAAKSPIMHTIEGLAPQRAPNPIVHFYGANQDGPIGSGFPDWHGPVLHYAPSYNYGYVFRYRFDKATPNDVVVGSDPGIRALSAADGHMADKFRLHSLGMFEEEIEALPDFAVLSIPQGLLVRMRFYSQQDMGSHNLHTVYVYTVQPGKDAVMHIFGVPGGLLPQNPLMASESSRLHHGAAQINMLVDARDAPVNMTMVLAGLQNQDDADGTWFVEFEVKPQI